MGSCGGQVGSFVPAVREVRRNLRDRVGASVAQPERHEHCETLSRSVGAGAGGAIAQKLKAHGEEDDRLNKLVRMEPVEVLPRVCWT